MRLTKYKISVLKCKPGMHLAEDVINSGSKLVAKNTILNSYIIDKLIRIGEYSVWVYASDNTKSLNKYKDIVGRFHKDYEVNVLLTKEIICKLVSTNKVDLNEVSQISNFIIRYLDEPSAVIECLNSIEKVDEYTYTHCVNVAIYSMLIARWMNLPSQSIKEVIQSGFLHDIGKTKIANDILNKPGKLTKEEFYEIKKHTIFGYELINQYNNFNENIKKAILMHHERIDGSGYPLGISEKDITLNAKIVSVADVFDAMTSNRVYKKGTTPFKAFRMFWSEGMKLYDASIIFILLDNLIPYYTGMKATLEDGRTGEIVYIPPRDVLAPIVKVNGELIDLSRESNLSITNVYMD